MLFTRITIDPAVCTGKPCIRWLRFPVARLLGLMATGETRDAILKTYPYIESGDIDYPRLLAVARASEPSLILFRNGNWSEADVRIRLSEILATLTEADIARSINVVDRDRVRRRR